MRLLLLIYVIVSLTLNFLIESFPVFPLVITTYPIAVYLLISKPAGRNNQQKLISISSKARQQEMSGFVES